MIRTPFPPRPPGAMGMVPAMPRPPIPGIPGVRPIIPPVVRPAVLPSVTPAEQPQTTIYIGRIAQSVDNDFMLSLLQVCYIPPAIFLSFLQFSGLYLISICFF